MKNPKNLRPLAEISREQLEGESDLLSHLMEEVGVKDLLDFEHGLAEQRSELLFKITTRIEDTENTLRQAEEIVKRLRRYLGQLRELHQALSK